MDKVTVTGISENYITFSDGTTLSSDHDQECCEQHYLSFEHLTLDDFKNLEFDLSTEDFFKRIEDYGIALNPLNNHPVRIPGYGYNNGCYSSDLTLTLTKDNIVKEYNISECQIVHD